MADLLKQILSHQIIIPTQELKGIFRSYEKERQEFLKEFKEKISSEGVSFGLYDLKKISKYPQKLIDRLRGWQCTYVREYIYDQNLKMGDFLSVTYLGLLLFDPYNVHEHKSNSKTAIKEDKFKEYMKDFYKRVMSPSKIRMDAKLVGRVQSDVILFSSTGKDDVIDRVDAYAFMEWASCLSFGNPDKKAYEKAHMKTEQKTEETSTKKRKGENIEISVENHPEKHPEKHHTDVCEHLWRIHFKYQHENIEFGHETTKSLTCSCDMKHIWFIYMADEKHSKDFSKIENFALTNPEFSSLNILLINYQVDSGVFELMNCRIKIFDAKSFETFPSWLK